MLINRGIVPIVVSFADVRQPMARSDISIYNSRFIYYIYIFVYICIIIYMYLIGDRYRVTTTPKFILNSIRLTQNAKKNTHFIEIHLH